MALGFGGVVAIQRRLLTAELHGPDDCSRDSIVTFFLPGAIMLITNGATHIWPVGWISCPGPFRSVQLFWWERLPKVLVELVT